MERFSVLIPVYIKENKEFFLQSIESILNQTLLPSEIVLVEDGPLTKELYQAIQNLKVKFPQLFNIVKLESNSGMGVAMNTGLINCSYNLVARMDSDDICTPDRFHKQVSFLQTNPSIDAVGSYIKEFKNSINDIEQVRKVPLEHSAIMLFAKNRNPMNHMTVMFRKDKALSAGGYWSHRVLEDYHLWYQMLKKNYRFANLPEIFVHARIGTNMIGRRKGFPYLKKEIFFFEKMYKENYISFFDLARAIIERSIMKIIPNRTLERLYTIILRK